MQAVPPDLPLQTIFIGRYADHFARDDGGWHFVSRDIEPRLVGDMRFHRADMAWWKETGCPQAARFSNSSSGKPASADSRSLS